MDLEVARVHSCRQTEQNPPRQLRPATHDASIELLAQAFNRSCRKSTGARVPNRRPRKPRAQHPLRGCMPHCKLESVDRFYERSAPPAPHPHHTKKHTTKTTAHTPNT